MYINAHPLSSAIADFVPQIHLTCQILLLLQLLLEFLHFGDGMKGRNSHPWNLGQAAGRGASNRGIPTVQQELSVINDPSACGQTGISV